MAKRRKRKGKNPAVYIGIGLIIMLGLFYVLNEIPMISKNSDGSTTFTTNDGEDFEGEVNEDGDCVSSSGDVGVCCWVEDSTTGELVSIPCEDAIVSDTDLQAFFTFQSGTTYDLSGFQLAIDATNTGNADAEVKIDSITISKTLEGTSNTDGEAEIMGAMTSIQDVWKPASVGQTASYSTDIIRIDTSDYKMRDGQYEITFDLVAKEPGAADSTAVSIGSKTVSMDIEQKVITFEIVVTQV